MTEPTTEASDPALDTVTLERDGHVLVMGLNRPDKRNAFNLAMLADLSRAYALLESDDTLRVGVLVANGDHFTAGLDLVDVGPAIAAGRDPFPDDGRDPWRLDGDWTKPVVAAAQGRCLTLGIELLLAADIRIAASDTRFAQLEVLRGIFPFGGATIRLPRQTGRGPRAGDRDRARHRRPCRASGRPGRAGVGSPGPRPRRRGSRRPAPTRGEPPVRHRRCGRGRAVVHRAPGRPIPWLLIGSRS
jgi:hypothetical protein